MAENINQTPTVVVDETAAEEQTPTRLQVFVNKHPRAAKVAAITGAIGTAVGAAMLTKTVSANRQHLDAASDHAQQALTELSTSVTPQESQEA